MQPGNTFTFIVSMKRLLHLILIMEYDAFLSDDFWKL